MAVLQDYLQLAMGVKMKTIGNVIVGQSGGPTAVINSSLAGVYETAKKKGAVKVFGMVNGIQGLLEENYVDLEEQFTSNLDIELLKRTPSSFLGSCRYKLPNPWDKAEVYEKLFEILNKLEVEYFFYIGGNDSMDTIKKLSEYAASIHSSIRFMGVPKTIDNDLEGTDHTPGFGSAAKFIGAVMKETIVDSLVYDLKSVTIVEIMGRNAGWLTGAAALSKTKECAGPDFIYLPEVPFSIDDFNSKVIELQKKKKSIVVAVSEGICLKDGQLVCELSDRVEYQDQFGHCMLSGAAKYLANQLSAKYGIKTRSIELNTLQRSASHLTSLVDITEAYNAGGAAVNAAILGETGKMVILKRASLAPYVCVTDTYDIQKIANLEKKVPRKWINEEGTYVTEEFMDYIKPLIQGELVPFMADGIPMHITMKR
ncbi:MAG: 6-phosphofructokinase [Anaerocolumna sp.]|nr:6-phosphofructokinase [Anaerocolumna sp.]